jgi:hypothetical protein
MKYCLIQLIGKIDFFLKYLKIYFSYRIRIRAVNTIGPGTYSSTAKCQTKSLPPDAPQLDCIAATCNSLKLKWGPINHVIPAVTNTTDQPTTIRVITYIIEMEGKDGK